MQLFEIITLRDDPLGAFVDGLIPSLVCILIVFVILTIIYLIVAGVNKIKALDDKEEQIEENTNAKTQERVLSMEEMDEDMQIAVLIATIDYQNETEKDVRIKNVRKIG